jgi:epoxyqueuosine reductase
MVDKRTLTESVRRKAQDLGFAFVGIAEAGFLADQAKMLENWLQAGRHGEMHYLEKNIDLRLDPRKLLPGTNSVISLMHNYYSDDLPANEEAPRISRYAYGKDYHKVLRKKLQSLLDYLREQVGDISGRGFSDSAPIMERAWAARAGLGWIGRNNLLIRKRQGSFFFLAELLVDVELEYDAPETRDPCGKCRLCVDACPTGAILDGRVIDASKCISYLTIEYRGELPEDKSTQVAPWIFGCDICQEVCPHNRWSTLSSEARFRPPEELLTLTTEQWRELKPETYERLFSGSAVQRAGFTGLQRNLNYIGLRPKGHE